MKNKTMLLALGLLALAFAAMPAVASAGSWEISPAPVSFTSTGGFSELRAANEPNITCGKNHGEGEYTSSTTGQIALTFEECDTSFFGFPVSCNSSGKASGVIAVASSQFHNIYLTDAKTTPGVLVTPPTGGVFATIICGSFAKIEVKGNGVIGDLKAPKCGASSLTGTLSFTATGAVQTYKQNTATGTSYNLTSTTESNGTPVEAAEVAEGTTTFGEEVTVNCV
jgi:hypothetical protein